MSTSPFASEAFFQQLLAKAIAARASDVHIKVGQPPGARVRGDMVYFRVDKVKAEDTEAAAMHLVRDPALRADMAALREHDCSYAIPGVGRFRVNVYRQRGTLAIVMRAIPGRIPTLEDLGAPQACHDLVLKDRGLVLVTGPTGSGKTSTLAAMIGQINRTRAVHIITIEDPIEFIHDDEKSSISQREVGIDTGGFAPALRAALRQDPDVIFVGEVRDEETMEIALKAAETGHLVLSTLHTPDVIRTINRILALAEGDQRELRERIADSLQGVIAQRLVPRADGSGQVLAAEVLVASGSVREAIKRPEGNPPLKDLIERGVHPYAMQTFEMHLKQLVVAGVIEKDVARGMMGF